MNIAEKMAEECADSIVYSSLPHGRRRITKLIATVAERGACKNKSAIACDTPITVIEGVEYVEVSRAQDAIDLNRWWEEEV